MQVYITKYALSKGIFTGEAEIYKEYYKVKGSYGLYNKKEAFENKSDAVNNAEERRINKLKSLDKQMKKLSALKFDL